MGNRDTQQMHQDLDAAKQAGANVVRLDVAWATLDSAGPGQLTAWYSQRLSQFTTYTQPAEPQGRRHRLHVAPAGPPRLPTPVERNSQGDWWSRGVGWYPPTNDAQFGDFVRYLTSTYGGGRAAIDLDWPRPRATTSSRPSGRRLCPAAQGCLSAAKAGNSTVPVLAGALSGADLPFVQTPVSGPRAQGYYDGLSLHSYCDGSPSGRGSARFEFQAGLEAMHALQSPARRHRPLSG